LSECVKNLVQDRFVRMAMQRNIHYVDNRFRVRLWCNPDVRIFADGEDIDNCVRIHA
jgi:hypothetical protein